MNALVSLSNVWNSEEDKECLGEAWFRGFSMCSNMSDLYFGVSMKQEHSKSSLLRRGWLWMLLCCHWLGQTARSLAMAWKCGGKCADDAHCWPGHPLLPRWLLTRDRLCGALKPALCQKYLSEVEKHTLKARLARCGSCAVFLTVDGFPLLSTQLIPRGFPSSRGVWERCDLLQYCGMCPGTEDGARGWPPPSGGMCWGTRSRSAL